MRADRYEIQVDDRLADDARRLTGCRRGRGGDRAPRPR
jgi:hypothetical protein